MKTKREKYDLNSRLDDLKNLLDIQFSDGNFDQDEYMTGLANGLLIAWYTLTKPCGAEVPLKRYKEKK